MNRTRLRHWLLRGLNATAAITLLLFALDKTSATRGLVSDGLLLLLIFALFLLVPLLFPVVFLLGRRAWGTSSSRCWL